MNRRERELLMFFTFQPIFIFDIYLETTSESGVSDLETSMTDFRCTCCPYGYHLDTDFMKFLDDMYGTDVLHKLKKIERKRHDVRRRLINEQQVFKSEARDIFILIDKFDIDRIIYAKLNKIPCVNL
jgi:hypothetical protein